MAPKKEVAADTKRGAPEHVQIDLGGYHAPVSARVDVLLEQLAAQGLHVVTAADKAVLDAMARVSESALRVEATHVEWITDDLAEPARAELSRREAAST